MHLFRLVCALASALVLIATQAQAGRATFKVSFMNCTEFVGEGNVSIDIAQKLVPAGYTITNAASGQAPIVVRITNCGSVQVNSGSSQPTTISQIGINIASPDGSGSINNYMALYVTNNQQLVAAFQSAGIPATFDPLISYEYTQNASGGVLYGAVSPREFGPYFLYGNETEPSPNNAQPFVANWWYGPNGAIRQQTTFPAISFGKSSVALYTSEASPLGQLMGGNVYSSFSLLSVRGVYSLARMVVSPAGQ